MTRAASIATLPHLQVLDESLVSHEGGEWAMAKSDDGLRLVVSVGRAPDDAASFEGEVGEHDGRRFLVGPMSARNAAALRAHLPWLRPRPLGLRASFGMGDRLGRATPGHVRAMRAAGRGLAPIFAQQSIREMTRTGRTPQEVLDAATWGAFQEGWTTALGADADHLKTAADIDACLAAGFTLFTIDPGDHVGSVPPGLPPPDLRAALDALPWARLDDSADAMLDRYAGRMFRIEGHQLTLTAPEAQRAAVKYGRAVAHVTEMSRHLAQAAGAQPVELEVSVDETDTPTSPGEHVYIATELRRLGVRWVSLAPRLLGSFEKGVDYIGDPAAFEADFAVHAAIARQLGPYKLSLHSGSDKFGIYDAVARQTRGLVHVKTAGTSYLEALRTLAATSPALFREVYAFARDHYEADRATYHVSARIDRAPDPRALADTDLPDVLNDFHARQVLHVTFGSVLLAQRADGRPVFADRLLAALDAGQEAYAANLVRHFTRHLSPFAPVALG